MSQTAEAYTIDRGQFFTGISHTLFKTGLKPQPMKAIDKMLSYWEEKFVGKPVSWLAYTLATAYHETDRTFGPIEEYGRGRGKQYAPYYGRGLVQLTWDYNYKKMGELLGLDLVKKPELALTIENAIPIIFEGMENGLFTGKGYGAYLTPVRTDYVNARRIINGTDRAALVAKYAKQFEAALVEAKRAKPVVVTKPVAETPKVTKTGWSLARVRNFLKASAASLATLFTVDMWGFTKEFLTQLKEFGTSTKGVILIGLGILLVWLVLEYMEKKKTNAPSPPESA